MLLNTVEVQTPSKYTLELPQLRSSWPQLSLMEHVWLTTSTTLALLLQLYLMGRLWLPQRAKPIAGDLFIMAWNLDMSVTVPTHSTQGYHTVLVAQSRARATARRSAVDQMLWIFIMKSDRDISILSFPLPLSFYETGWLKTACLYFVLVLNIYKSCLFLLIRVLRSGTSACRYHRS